MTGNLVYMGFEPSHAALYANMLLAMVGWQPQTKHIVKIAENKSSHFFLVLCTYHVCV